MASKSPMLAKRHTVAVRFWQPGLTVTPVRAEVFSPGKLRGQCQRTAAQIVALQTICLSVCRWAGVTMLVWIIASLQANCLQEKPKSPPPAGLQQMRMLVQRQLDLIQAKKAEELRQHFTPRLREHITPELLQEVQPRLAKVKIEELVVEIRQVEKNGRHLVIVRRDGGRLLTVFVWHHDNWLADTLWFR